MGTQEINPDADGGQRREFVRNLLDDLTALEYMLDHDRFESGVRRIGAEQELFLVDSEWRPAPAALHLLEQLDDPRFSPELGLFNLEISLAPRLFGGGCLGALEAELLEALSLLRDRAGEQGLGLVLTGILPTLRLSDLGLENMTPRARYRTLNEAMSKLRGGAYEFHIKGLDELLVKHDSVMLEACNASFQVHFQVAPAEFANLYNLAQLVAGPVLAAAVNSPVLFGRRLWRETRIALFQQAVDTRSSMHFLRERSPRVTFGRDWVKRSVLELFHEDIARFRAVVTSDVESNASAELARGTAPALPALCLFNSTVYRWNRACYGVTQGRAHLRIENRVLPAGPTVADEVANAALWFGLISALSRRFEDITQAISFEEAKLNFSAAARLGLSAQLGWLDGRTLPAATLIRDELLPLAAEGLSRAGIDRADAERYLAIIDRRVDGDRTGARWTLSSLAAMNGQGSLAQRLQAITAAMAARQRENLPVGEWDAAGPDEAMDLGRNQAKVEQHMTTDLYTVGEDESLDLVASMMAWKHIRHVPVEDNAHRLVGLISYRALLKLFARHGISGVDRRTPVSEIMKRDPVTIAPDATIDQAIAVMRERRIAALPVVKDGRLIGIITERDLLNMAAELLGRQIDRS